MNTLLYLIIQLIIMERTTDTLFNAPDGLAQMFVMIGKSGRGKSCFTRYLLTDRLSRSKWKFGLVFGDFSFLPDKRVIEGYNEDVLRKYIDNLRQICEKE